MQQQAESRWASKRTWPHTQHAGETKVRTGSQSDTESAHKAASSKVATVAVNEAISDDETPLVSLTESRSVSQARLEDTELQPGLVVVKPAPGVRYKVAGRPGDRRLGGGGT